MERFLERLNWSLAALAIVLGAITLSVRLRDCPFQPVPVVHQRFRPALFAITSVDAAIRYLPAYYKRPNPTDLEKVQAVDDFVQDRFFHGFSKYRPCDNWIANVAGTVWSDLASPVSADDILKYRRAICSQQAIVVEAMLQRLAIQYGSITFQNPNHFVPAARIDGTWYYMDPDLERPGLTPLIKVAKGGALRRIYPGRFGQSLDAAAAAGRMQLRDIGRFPGPRGAAFDEITDFLSAYGWALFAGLFLLLNVSWAGLLLRGRSRVAWLWSRGGGIRQHCSPAE